MRKLLLLALLAVGLSVPAWAKVVIELQPRSPVTDGGPVPIGTSFSLTVRAAGRGPLAYQWRRNGVNVPGETNSSLPFEKFVYTDGGAYSVAVTDVDGTVPSVTVKLVPDLRPLPFIDDFPPTSKNVLPGDSGNGVGSNANATVQRAAGEPFHAGDPGGASMWIEWRPTQTGIAQLFTVGSDFDTLLAVYVAGAKPDLVSLVPVQSNDEIGLYHNSGVQFNVTANWIYFIAVDGKGAGTPKGGRGDIVLAWDLTATTFLLPIFNFEPPDANHAPGESFDLKVDFTPPKGASNSIQWFRNGVPIEGATSPTLSFNKITPREVGRHFARITSTLKETRRTIQSKPTDIQIYKRKDDTDNGVLARDFYLRSFADGQASKQGGSRALPASVGHGVPLSLASGISGTQVFNTTGASSDAGEPMICGIQGGSSEWYSILCADAGTVVIDTQGSSFDTLLGAYFDTGAGDDVYDGLEEVACNNDISKENRASRIVFKVSEAKVYSLDMDGVGGATGIVQLNYALYAPLKIVSGPASQTVSQGSTVIFSVSTAGYVSDYQWLKGGAPIPGEKSSTLTLTGVTAANNGDYSVMVDNEAGEGATSVAAKLTVQAPPQVTGDPVSVTVNQGQTANFTVTATGTDPLGYQWRKGGFNLAGKTSATLSIVGAQPADEGSYDCVVTNSVGTDTSAAATLSVRVAPNVTGDPVSQTVNPGDPVSFTVTATGTAPLGYQWRKGGSNLPGKTAATLAIASCVAGDEGSYDCVVSNLAGSDTSNPATLTVRVAPNVTVDPVSQTVNPGDPVSFSVTATGTGPLGYQWRKGGANLPGKTASSLSLVGVQAADEGSYDCVVSNLAGTDTSNPATLTVRTVPTITTPPASQTIVQGNPVTFSVLAAGSATLVYQWQRATTNIPGATGTSYQIPSVVLADAGSYRVVVTNAAGSVTSVAATLTVQVPAQVTGEPVNQTVNQGDTANFTVTATGTPAPTYQWRKGGSALPGKTSATLSIVGAQPADEGSYDCVVSNAAGTDTSNPATLAVRVAPNVTTDPVSQTVNPGDPVSFSVTATGTAILGYQWRKGGSNLPGKTAATLSLVGVQAADEGSYDCVVSNLAGSDTSAAATLTVRTVPTITTPPASQTIVQGNPVTFSVVAAGSATLTYQWQRATTNIPGATGTSYTIPSAVLSDAGSYRVVVTNAAGSVTSSAATLTVQVPAQITGEPANQTVNQGDTATFTVTATGTPAPTYQWRKGGSALPGKTAATLSVVGAQPADEGSYDCVVSNAAGTDTSNPATLTVRVAPNVTTDPVSQTVNPGDPVSFIVAATGTAPLSYQWRKGGSNLPGKTAATLSLVGVQSTDAGTYDCVVSNLAGTDTSAAATLTVRTVPTITTPPASQTIVQGSPVTFSVVAAGSATLTYQWQRATTNIPGATGTSYMIPSVTLGDAGSYRVVVTNLAGSVTSAAATLSVQVPAQVTGEPTNQTVNQGDTATFTVTATGTPAPTYQWRKGGSALPGKTSATLSLVGAQPADEGSYDCVVSNAAGTDTSNPATLTVRVKPNVTTDPVSQTVNPADSVSFTVIATGTGPLAYQWRKGGSNLPGKTAATLTIASCVAGDAGSYDCVVTNLAGTDTSAAATLTVRVAPTITTPPANLSRVVGQSATFSVVATGTATLAYQWQKGTTNIPGATGTNYVIPSVALTDAGSYRVVVTNAAGSVTSVAATLSVSAAVGPSFVVFELVSDNHLHLRLQGTPGFTYKIQSSPDLTTWTDVMSSTPADGVIDYTAPSPVSGPGLVYRALGP